jgi:cytochrome P450
MVSEEERNHMRITNHNVKGFIPFGAGQYSCVGKQLALVKMRLFSSSISETFGVGTFCSDSVVN